MQLIAYAFSILHFSSSHKAKKKCVIKIVRSSANKLGCVQVLPL